MKTNKIIACVTSTFSNIFSASVSANSSYLVDFSNIDWFEVKFLAYVQFSNSSSFNDSVSFFLSNSAGDLVHTFPTLSGQLNFATLVSELVGPCEVAQWPSQMTLGVSILSNSSLTLQVGITVESTDFFMGSFILGTQYILTESILSFSKYYNTFSIPNGTSRYDILFSIESVANASIPFSNFCISPISIACNSTCIVQGQIFNGTNEKSFVISNLGAGTYIGTYDVTYVGASVMLYAIIQVHGAPTTSSTASSNINATTSLTSTTTHRTTTSTAYLTSTTHGIPTTSTSHLTSTTNLVISSAGTISLLWLFPFFCCVLVVS